MCCAYLSTTNLNITKAVYKNGHNYMTLISIFKVIY